MQRNLKIIDKVPEERAIKKEISAKTAEQKIVTNLLEIKRNWITYITYRENHKANLKTDIDDTETTNEMKRKSNFFRTCSFVWWWLTFECLRFDLIVESKAGGYCAYSS